MAKKSKALATQSRNFVLILAVSVMLLIPMSYETAQASQDKVITIYAAGDYSGPYGGLTTPGMAAHRDVMKYWKEKNLIPGAKYKLKWADSGGILSRATSIFRRFKNSKPKPLLIVVAQTGEAEALRHPFEESKIILFTWGASAKVCTR